FTMTSGTLSFDPDVSAMTVRVPVIGDPWDEADEDLFVQLASPTDTTLTDAQARGVIVDDDSTPGVAVEATAAKAGAPFVFASATTASSNQTITVRYDTVNGT